MSADHTGEPPIAGSATARISVAVLDADTGFLQVLTRRLAAHGWQHRMLRRPEPPSALVPMRIDALVVDLLALGPDGWSYLHRLSAELPALSVVVCSGGSSVADRVRALRAGADDWLVKPCHPEELIARVEAVVRRRRRAHAPSRQAVSAGGVSIRPDRFQAYAGERSLELTGREFALLRVLAEEPGRVHPREELYRRVWGYTMAHGDRSVDVFVRKLRNKLERGSPGWRYIHTHFGVGYRFDPQPVDGGGAGEADAHDGREEPLPARA